jgi:serine/threonine protein kinase
MPLSPGTSLGHYNVTALIGEGGMGRVWQATDTQLNRQVCGEGRRAVGSSPAVRFYVRVTRCLRVPLFFRQPCSVSQTPERGPHHLTMWQILAVYRLA